MNAEDTPTNGPQSPAPDEEPTAVQKRLTRSRSDRVLGGVCGGLGRYFNTDPIFFRIGAIALAFLGGAGLLVYLAAVLLIPADDGAAVLAPNEGRNRGLAIAVVVLLLLVTWPFLLGFGFLAAGLAIPLALLVGAGVLAWWLASGEGPSGDAKDIARRAALGVGLLILCFILAIGGFFVAATGPGWLVPTLVIGAGVAIVAGAFLRPVRWLVLPAVAVALSAGVVGASGVDLDGGVGEREYRPASTADLRERYELGMGELVVDLRETDLPAGDVPLQVDLGMGEARVLVPEDVCVATTAEIGMGNVSLFGRNNEGVDIDFDERPEAEPATTRLLLDAEIGMGELRVDDDRYAGFDRDYGRFDEPVDPNANAACASTGERASG